MQSTYSLQNELFCIQKDKQIRDSKIIANYLRNLSNLNHHGQSVNYQLLSIPLQNCFLGYNRCSLNNYENLPIFSQSFGMESNQVLVNEVLYLKDLLNKIKDECMDQTGDSFMRQGMREEEYGDCDSNNLENEKEIQQFYEKVISLYRISVPGSSQKPDVFEVLKWINSCNFSQKQAEVKVGQSKMESRKSLNKKELKSSRKSNKENKEGLSIRLNDSQEKSIKKKKKKSSLMNKLDQNAVKRLLETLMSSTKNESKDKKVINKKQSKDNKKRADSSFKIPQNQKKSMEGSQKKRVSSLTKQKKFIEKKESVLEVQKMKKGKQKRSSQESLLKNKRTDGKNKLIESLKNENLGVSKLLKRSRKTETVMSSDKKSKKRDLNKNQSQQNLKQKKRLSTQQKK